MATEIPGTQPSPDDNTYRRYSEQVVHDSMINGEPGALDLDALMRRTPHPSRILDGDIKRPVERLSEQERRTLDRAFHRTETLTLPDNQQLVINDVRPETECGLPVVFVSGYYAEADSFNENMLDTVLMGRRVLGYNSYHGINMPEEFLAKYAPAIRKLERADPGVDIKPQLRKVAALIAMIQAKGLSQVDVFAHSEGAVVLAIASYLEPALFARRAMLNPGGLTGKPVLGPIDVITGKIQDDVIELGFGRLETLLSNGWKRVQTLLHDYVSSGIPLPRSPQDRFAENRKISPRYAQDPIDAEGNFREGDITAEYAAGNAQHLQNELHTLSNRDMRKWLAMIHPENNLIIGTSLDDRIYPSEAVDHYARDAGVPPRNIYFLTASRDKAELASHNVHHYRPEKVTHFLREALAL